MCMRFSGLMTTNHTRGSEANTCWCSNPTFAVLLCWRLPADWSVKKLHYHIDLYPYTCASVYTELLSTYCTTTLISIAIHIMHRMMIKLSATTLISIAIHNFYDFTMVSSRNQPWCAVPSGCALHKGIYWFQIQIRFSIKYVRQAFSPEACLNNGNTLAVLLKQTNEM